MDVYEFSTKEDLFKALDSKEVNALCIDLYHDLGVKKSVQLIMSVRERYSHIPICLLGEKKALENMSELSQHWRTKFKHYYKFYYDEASAEQALLIVELLSVMW
ncbi:hypothetical protein I0E51_06200 [Pseudomonas lalucatii]|nr:hypothetical protein [Pseudomonas lalucatii]